MTRLQPALLLHGHVAVCGPAAADRRLGRTIVRNVTGRHLFDLEPATGRVTDVTGHHGGSSGSYHSASYHGAPYPRAGSHHAR